MSSSNGACAKLERAESQLINAERLILQLPKQWYKDPQQREELEIIATQIYTLSQKIKAIADSGPKTEG